MYLSSFYKYASCIASIIWLPRRQERNNTMKTNLQLFWIITTFLTHLISLTKKRNKKKSSYNFIFRDHFLVCIEKNTMSSLRPPKYIWISFGWNIKPRRAGSKWNLISMIWKVFLHLALKHLVLDIITGIKTNKTAPRPLYFLRRLFQLHVKMILLCCSFFCWLEESAVLFYDLVRPADPGWSCVCSEIMHNLEQ